VSSEHDTKPRRAGQIRNWAESVDVIVVGYGCAGAAAALEATAVGADVLVLERASGGGGTSANSGGLIYLGGGTRIQKACGFDDTPEAMFKFLMAACGPGPDEQKIRVFCDRSVEQFEWLCAQGVPFKESFFPEPGTEPPTDDCLVYSGGEDCHPFNRIAKPAPRAHKPQTPGAAGAFLMQHMLAACERTGIRVSEDTRCTRLIVDDDDRVVGVTAVRNGEETAIRAGRGVVLTAGGFINNKAMVERYAPVLLRGNYRLGVDGDDGAGIRMAMSVGARTIRMDTGSVSVPLYPPKALTKGILVNMQGQRFINEDTYYGRTGQVAAYTQDARMFLIVDASTYIVNNYGMEAAFVEETVDELEKKIGLPEGSLVSTVELYNRHAAHGKDPVFHKGKDFVVPLVDPPFGAIDCSRDAAIYAVFTLGGLHTTPDGRVLDYDGAPIHGLYAAGRTTSGVSAFGYASGVSLADGMFFGRLAGESAAAG
jgi:3-oxo-5alpha-steroid 4-dehydrogenase